MIREEKFLISRRPYAVDLGSLKVKERPLWPQRSRYSATVRAVWFRRRSGITVACWGYLWNASSVEPRDAKHFLELHDDGRYGGTTVGRWDGSGYWGNQVTLDEQETQLAVLRPMLENYPAIPPGYDGWWRFETAKELHSRGALS